MKEINDKKGIDDKKLGHIFKGNVWNKNGNIIVSGYHCDRKLGDENVAADTRLYPKTKRIITANKSQKLFEAQVYDIKTKTIKAGYGGKSTFFNPEWTRQDVVDCISRLQKKPCIIKEYRNQLGKKTKKIYIDKQTGLIVYNSDDSKNNTAYPILRY